MILTRADVAPGSFGEITTSSSSWPIAAFSPATSATPPVPWFASRPPSNPMTKSSIESPVTSPTFATEVPAPSR